MSKRASKKQVEQQMARVNVSDAVWLEFRTACLANGEHVSDALARLVTRELARSVARERGRNVGDGACRTPVAPTLFDLGGRSEE